MKIRVNRRKGRYKANPPSKGTSPLGGLPRNDLSVIPKCFPSLRNSGVRKKQSVQESKKAIMIFHISYLIPVLTFDGVRTHCISSSCIRYIPYRITSFTKPVVGSFSRYPHIVGMTFLHASRSNFYKSGIFP